MAVRGWGTPSDTTSLPLGPLHSGRSGATRERSAGGGPALRSERPPKPKALE
jgi:hypothetical protein